VFEGLVKVTKVYANGRTQIPAEVRRILGIADGDNIAWFIDTEGKKAFIVKAPKPRKRYKVIG